MPMQDQAVLVRAELEVEQETDHEKWSDEPIYHNTEANLNPDGSLAEDEMESFIFDFAKDRIHHDKESNSCTRSAGPEHSWNGAYL
jgi:hypothetical protein